MNNINTIYDDDDKVKSKFTMTEENIMILKQYVKLEQQCINEQKHQLNKKKTLDEINGDLNKLSFNIDKYFLKPISKYEKKIQIRKNEDEKTQSNQKENSKTNNNRRSTVHGRHLPLVGCAVHPDRIPLSASKASDSGNALPAAHLYRILLPGMRRHACSLCTASSAAVAVFLLPSDGSLRGSSLWLVHDQSDD